jgi:5'-3' exonuclease
MERTLAIIDGDSLCYLCSKETIDESLERIDSLFKKILDKTGSTSYYLFLSKGPYFRHDVNIDYKGKRSSSPLKYLKTLNKYLREQYLGEHWKGVEADDAVSYVQQLFLSGALPEFDKTFVCSIDKDVKEGVPGHTYNYGKDEFSYTTPEEAEMFLHIQAIMGDSTDNIKGIPGTGEVKATKLISAARPELHPLIGLKAYLEHFKAPNKGIHEYQKNFKQVYLLRTPEDFLDAVGYVPELNDPITII